MGSVVDTYKLRNPFLGTSIANHLIVGFLTVTTLLSILLRIDEVRLAPQAWVRVVAGVVALGLLLSVRYLGWIRAATIALSVEAIAGIVTLTTIDIPFIEQHRYDFARAIVEVWENAGHKTPRDMYLHDSLTVQGRQLITLSELPVDQIHNSECTTFWMDTHVLGTAHNWIWIQRLQIVQEQCTHIRKSTTNAV